MLVSHPLCRLLVSFAGTKHCCLTAVNRDGALCCPDFPRDRGLKPRLFFPYPAMNRHAMSGIRESNPPPRLGKPMHYRCANAANNFRCKGSKNIARMQIFCLKVQKKTTTPLLMGSRQATNHTKKDALQRLLWVTSGALAHLPLATKNYYVVKVAATVRSPQKKCAFSLQCTIVFGDPSFNGFSPSH